MIAAQDINDWLGNPQTLQNIHSDTLNELSEQYPYFNIGLILQQLKNAGHLNDIQLITNINPVYKAILTAEYHDSYTPIHYHETTIENQIHTETEAEENIVEEETISAADITPEAEATIQAHHEAEAVIAEEIIVTPEEEDTNENTATIPATHEIEIIQKEADTKQEMPIFTEAELTLDELYKQEAPIMDYFASEGLKIAHEIPEDISSLKKESTTTLNWNDENKPMVVMSFTEWLTFITKKKAKEQAELESKSALKALWQKEKLAQAIEEESEEIPEEVFEMAVNSIAQQDEIVSETMADIYARQNKIEKAIDMYKKLSLQHPEKNAYFAEKIASLQKDI